MSGARAQAVRVGDVELAYEEHGAGERPFLLVHGFTGARADFAESLPALAAEGRTLALDLRGHGDSSNPGVASAYSFERLATDVLGFLDALGIERCDLLGHSMGGRVALRLALEHPERLHSLVLMDTAARPTQPSQRALFELGGKLVRERGMQALVGYAQKEHHGDPRRSADAAPVIARIGEQAYLAQVERKLLAMDPEAFAVLGLEFAEHESLVPRLGEIRLPTSVLVGALDAPYREPSDELAAGIPGARLVVIEEAGRSPQASRPEAWLAAVREHLQRVRRVPS